MKDIYLLLAFLQTRIHLPGHYSFLKVPGRQPFQLISNLSLDLLYLQPNQPTITIKTSTNYAKFCRNHNG